MPPTEAQKLAERYGLPVAYCCICDCEFVVEKPYHEMGLCGVCARRAGAAWVLAHSGKHDQTLDPEGFWRDAQRRDAERPYRKRVIAKATRTKVFERDAYRCMKCGGHTRLSIDHIHPEVLGGTESIDNLQTLCLSCNSKKGARAA